jgi:hypothetical protein
MSTAAASVAPATENPTPSRLALLPYALAANRPLAGAVVVGAAVETALLSIVPGGIFECEGPSRYQVPFYLLAVWWLTGWGLSALFGTVGVVDRRLPWAGRLLGAAAVVGLLVALLSHLASWGMYFRTGRFGTVDAVEFLSCSATRANRGSSNIFGTRNGSTFSSVRRSPSFRRMRS